MTRVMALKPHSYAQKNRVKGEKYDARPEDVRLLELMKLVRRDEPETPAMIAPDLQPEVSYPVVEPTKQPKRRYRRRDMKAED
jgi:hypothetical protein